MKQHGGKFHDKSNTAGAPRTNRQAPTGRKQNHEPLRGEPGEMLAVSLPLIAFATTAAPLYNTASAARNHAAVIQREEPTAPGGLVREFIPACKGHFYYDFSEVQRGDVIEFAADVRMRRGRKARRRAYYTVLQIQADDSGDGEALLRQFDTAREALNYAPAFIPSPAAPLPTVERKGADIARKFAAQLAFETAALASKYEDQVGAAGPGETADEFAVRLLITATRRFDHSAERPLKNRMVEMNFSRA